MLPNAAFRSATLLAFAAVLTSTTGCFLLDRADALPAGTVVGVVIRADGAPAAGAVVSFPVLRLSARADGDGRFRVGGLPVGGHALTALVDADADGVADEGALAVIVVRPAGGSGEAVGTDVGRVQLAPTGSLTGRTVDAAAAAIGAASLAVWRTATLSDGADDVVVDLAAEQLIESGPDGRFLVRGLIAGPVFVAGFDSVADIATRAGAPRAAIVPAGDVVDVGDLDLLTVDGARDARVTLARVEPDVVEIRLAPTGKAPPGEATATVIGSRSFVIAVPVGVWDVYLKSGTRTAILLAQVAPPPGPEVVSWGIADLVDRGVVCGDAILSPGEACDDGAGNSDVAADACRSTCTLPSCGDGVVDTVEGCDDGTANSDTVADACRATCQPAACGDGVIDSGEVCDDGASNSDTLADACRSTCANPACGDGVVDVGEDCDEGPANSDVLADACRPGCTLPVCGDGVVDEGEGCDDGDANTGVACVPSGVAPCSVCLATCTPFSASPVATVRVAVKSAQGWGTLPLEGVRVTFGASVAVTDGAGVATLDVALPVAPGAAIVVGDHRDPQIPDRSFTRTLVPVPAGLVHGGAADAEAIVLEGCAVDGVGEVNRNLNETCVFLEASLGWSTGTGPLLVEGEAGPLADTAPFVVRAAAMPNATFDDTTAVMGFPPLVTTDGRRLRCGDLYDVRVDGADPDPTSGLSPVIDLGTPPSERPSEQAFRFDESAGGFVEDPTAIVEGTMRLPREGIWCFGRAEAPEACLLVSVSPTGAAVNEPVTVDLVWDSLGVSRTSVVVPPGGSTCAPVFSNTFIGATAITSDGRRGVGTAFEAPLNFDSCANESACGAMEVVFEASPSDGCVVFAPTIDVDGSVVPAAVPIAIAERRENRIYRSRLLVDDTAPGRCLLIPNEVGTIEWEIVDLGAICTGIPAGVSAFGTTARTVEPTPSIGGPVCTEDPIGCDRSLGDILFSCVPG